MKTLLSALTEILLLVLTNPTWVINPETMILKLFLLFIFAVMTALLSALVYIRLVTCRDYNDAAFKREYAYMDYKIRTLEITAKNRVVLKSDLESLSKMKRSDREMCQVLSAELERRFKK
jgi:hypothetical protein